MVKVLTKVGNSKAVIIPKKMIENFSLNTYSLEETEKGILIIPSDNKNTFQQKVIALKAQKNQLYKRMQKESEDKETIQYYKQNTVDEIDLDIIEE